LLTLEGMWARVALVYSSLGDTGYSSERFGYGGYQVERRTENGGSYAVWCLSVLILKL
jgi:hypothetical protein